MILQRLIAPVDQLDRSSDYGSEGWEFRSSRALHWENMENELNLKGSFVDGKWFDEGKVYQLLILQLVKYYLK